MRTVPTLAASCAGLSLSAVGLTLARPDDDNSDIDLLPPTTFHTASTSRPATRRQPRDMTAVATYNPLFSRDSPIRNHTLSPSRSVSGPQVKPPSRGTLSPQDGLERRSTLSGYAGTRDSRVRTPRSSWGEPGGKTVKKQHGSSHRSEESSPAQSNTPSSRPHSWLRRLSSSMASSRDSSQAPASRPASQHFSRPPSTVASRSNGSAFTSQDDSAALVSSESSPATLPPNKLVKRSSSFRSNTSSPFASSASSRLPLPVFKRPATSHQRSADMRKFSLQNDFGRDFQAGVQLRQFFTPRVASESRVLGRRRHSGIPNPIKRVYPDRKYTPMLVSAGEPLRPARMELDDGISDDEDDEMEVAQLHIPLSVASSPITTQGSSFAANAAPRRSFSIGDLLSTGPQLSQHTRRSSNRLTRRHRPRVASAPYDSMGSSVSSNVGSTDLERPAKRREVADSTTSNISTPHASQYRDLQPVMGSSPLADFPKYVDTSTTPPTLAPSPFEAARQVSLTSETSTTRKVSTVGSDSENRSVGGFSTDYQSEFDSYPTRATRSSSGKRGPPIDAIFDDSPPALSSGRSVKLRDILGDVSLVDHDARYRHSTIEEEGSVLSTPVRSLRDKSVTSTPSARPGAQQLFGSSPPAIGAMPEPDDIDWDAPDDSIPSDSGLGIRDQDHRASTPRKTVLFRAGAFPGSFNISPSDAPDRHGKVDRATLFDWAEQQPSPSHADSSPPRPRTVHGKKDPDSRGSRPNGRRAPSGMHARSHSVPVVPDVDGKRTNIVANKFGTWGVGTKAVTEDWNEDFDFDDDSASPKVDDVVAEERRIDSGHEMFVPPAIRQQQENVVAHIGLLREWGLLIEELKELRVRAVQLGMLSGPYGAALREVDGMIELADQESEETTLAASKSPPSSPGFDEDDVAPTRFGSPATTKAYNSPSRLAGASRPRKDSEAVARLVIEALQAKRAVSDLSGKAGSSGSNKKVPFDTATLRHIVPYVNSLKRKIKDGLRETEGLYYSPRRKSSSDHFEATTPKAEAPPFGNIFDGPAAQASPRGRTRREAAMTDHDMAETWDNRDGLSSQMQKMDLARD